MACKLTVEYIKQKCKIHFRYWQPLKEKVLEAFELENKYSEINLQKDDILISFDNNLNYKYQISYNIWGQGKKLF